ncbi:MAG: aminotransferase class V-fold PLP-dependent enzyme [Lysobacterales bacterium]|jgi:cysteine desulfurase family protein (TIGR01976 family)
MVDMDTGFVRAQFPAFSEPSLEGFTHFENAGGSYACGAMIEALHDYYRATKVQPYYCFEPSSKAGAQMDRARERMAEWLNVTAEEVHFGTSTSQNTYVVAQALRQYLQPGDEIIVTNQDHEANVGAWRRLEEAGMVVREWRIDPESGELDGAGLENLLGERTRVVAFTHCSNIIGSMHPVNEWCEKIHAAGAIAIVDGVSYAGHGLPDVTALGADIYLFSMYKVYGPHLGVMTMRADLNRRLPNQGHFFNEGYPTARFTPAGPDHAQIASVNGVLDYFESVYAHHFGNEQVDPVKRTARVRALFQHTERRNLQPLLDFLSQKEGVRLIGKTVTKKRAPTVSFVAEAWKPLEVARELAARNIGIGHGHCYAYRLIEALGLPIEHGVVRTSFVHYTSASEIERLIEALDEIL